jgi:hypothetical protein
MFPRRESAAARQASDADMVVINQERNNSQCRLLIAQTTFQLMEAFVKSTALAASMLVFVSVGAALSQDAAPGNPTNTGFMAQQPNDRLASRLVGLNIQNTGNENIGEIHDIVLTDAGAVKAFVVSVGGFLGMGTRYVAIDPKAVTLTRQDEKTWKATMNANKDQLRAAPEYKYESEWRKR